MKHIVFTSQARADLRHCDVATTVRISAGLQRFVQLGAGDVKKLKGNTDDLRLRVGDWRVRFVEEAKSIVVKRVLHRSEAYRRV